MFESSLQLQQLRQKRRLFPYERQQAELGVYQSRANLAQTQPNIGRTQADIGQTLFSTSRGQQLLPYELGQAGLSMQKGEAELQDFLAGTGARTAERQFAEAQAKSRLAFLPMLESARSAVAGRITQGANRPQMAGGQPSWMQSYSVPEFVKPKKINNFIPQLGNNPLTQNA